MPPSARPAYATELVAPRELHMEVIDPTTRAVWESIEPSALADYTALEVEAPVALFFANRDGFQGPLGDLPGGVESR